jgi:hypothetical protein
MLKRILDHSSQVMTDNEKDDNAVQIKWKWQYKPDQSHHLKGQIQFTNNEEYDTCNEEYDILRYLYDYSVKDNWIFL